ncbi:MAG: transcription-repair coupling factor, partial [Bacteroidota bacterium]
MKIKEFISLCQQDASVQLLKARLTEKHTAFQLKGLAGSQDAAVASALYGMKPGPNLFIMNDREEAAYFYNDLQSLLEEDNPHLFPGSYKKPYTYEEIENANVLQRAEVLSIIGALKAGGAFAVVTWPEALVEKVINRRSLRENTFGASVGDKLDLNFISEVLNSYDFDRVEFVTEPGQFSIRGGIVDIWSYSGDLPFRMELFGNDVESIRTFNPETQLSVEQRKSLSIVPDVQTRLYQEKRESFADFLPEGTLIWVKDLNLCGEVLDKAFDRAEAEFSKIKAITGGTVSDPAEIFDDYLAFQKSLLRHKVLEFGLHFLDFKKSKKEPPVEITFTGRAQVNFNKDFNMVAEALNGLHDRHYTTIISSESDKIIKQKST